MICRTCSSLLFPGVSCSVKVKGKFPKLSLFALSHVFLSTSSLADPPQLTNFPLLRSNSLQTSQAHHPVHLSRMLYYPKIPCSPVKREVKRSNPINFTTFGFVELYSTLGRGDARGRIFTLNFNRRIRESG